MKNVLAIVIILGLATGLRLMRLDLIEFKTDESVVLRLAAAELWPHLPRYARAFACLAMASLSRG